MKKELKIPYSKFKGIYTDSLAHIAYDGDNDAWTVFTKSIEQYKKPITEEDLIPNLFEHDYQISDNDSLEFPA